MMNIHVVIDRSGSMWTMQAEAIGGFNTFFEDTKKSRNQRWYVWLFDSGGIDLINDGVTAKNVELLTEENYVPRACTPLFDAVGQAVEKGKENEADKNVLVVLTDGYENASRDYTREQIRKELEGLEKKDWQIVFIAAGPESWSGLSMFDGLGTTVRSASGGKSLTSSYGLASQTVAAYAVSESTIQMSCDVDEEGNVS